MGTDRAGRIGKGCSILYFNTLNRIRIVTAPDLWCIIQHSRIKPAAATAASLNQKIRVTFMQPFQKIINIEHFRNLCKNTVHHFFSGIVGHKLIACTHRHLPRSVFPPASQTDSADGWMTHACFQIPDCHAPPACALRSAPSRVCHENESHQILRS